MHTLEVCSCCSPVLPSSSPSLFPLFSVIYLLFIFSASPLSLFPPFINYPDAFLSLGLETLFTIPIPLPPCLYLSHSHFHPGVLTPTVCISFTLSLIHHFPSFPLLLTSSILFATYILSSSPHFLLPLESKHFTLDSPLSSLK